MKVGTKMPPRGQSLQERLDYYSMPEPNSGCLLWFGPVHCSGYPHIKVRGVSYFMHRVAWELINGPVPAGLLVCHKCDIPACVNAHHLFVGTCADNNNDCDRKGRRNPEKGEKRYNAKLTNEVVRYIRFSDESYGVLAKRFGVAKPTIYKVKKRIGWKHVPQPEGDEAQAEP